MRERAARVPPLQAQPRARRVRGRPHRTRVRLCARCARRRTCRRLRGLTRGCIRDKRRPERRPRAHVRRRAALRGVGAARLPARRDAWHDSGDGRFGRARRAGLPARARANAWLGVWRHRCGGDGGV